MTNQQQKSTKNEQKQPKPPPANTTTTITLQTALTALILTLITPLTKSQQAFDLNLIRGDIFETSISSLFPMSHMRNPAFKSLNTSLKITQPMQLTDEGIEGNYTNCTISGRLNLFDGYLICNDSSIIIQRFDAQKNRLLPHTTLNLQNSDRCITAEIKPDLSTIYFVCLKTGTELLVVTTVVGFENAFPIKRRYLFEVEGVADPGSILDTFVYVEGDSEFLIVFKRDYALVEAPEKKDSATQIFCFEMKANGTLSLFKTFDKALLPELAQADSFMEVDYHQNNLIVLVKNSTNLIKKSQKEEKIDPETVRLGTPSVNSPVYIISYYNCSIFTKTPCKATNLPINLNITQGIFQINREITQRFPIILSQPYSATHLKVCKIKSTATELKFLDCTLSYYNQEPQPSTFPSKIEISDQGILLKFSSKSTQKYTNFAFMQKDGNYYYQSPFPTNTVINMYRSLIAILNSTIQLYSITPSGLAQIRSSLLPVHQAWNVTLFPNMYSDGVQLSGYMMDGPFDRSFFRYELPNIVAYRAIPIPYLIDSSYVVGNDLRVFVSSEDNRIQVTEDRFINEFIYEFEDLSIDDILKAVQNEDYMTVQTKAGMVIFECVWISQHRYHCDKLLGFDVPAGFGFEKSFLSNESFGSVYKTDNDTLVVLAKLDGSLVSKQFGVRAEQVVYSYNRKTGFKMVFEFKTENPVISIFELISESRKVSELKELYNITASTVNQTQLSVSGISFDPFEQNILYVSTSLKSAQIYKLRLEATTAVLNDTLNLSYQVTDLCVSRSGVTVFGKDSVKSLDKDTRTHSRWTYPIQELGVNQIDKVVCIPKLSQAILLGSSNFKSTIAMRLDLDKLGDANQRVPSVQSLDSFFDGFAIGSNRLDLILSYRDQRGFVRFFNYFSSGYFFRINFTTTGVGEAMFVGQNLGGYSYSEVKGVEIHEFVNSTVLGGLRTFTPKTLMEYSLGDLVNITGPIVNISYKGRPKNPEKIENLQKNPKNQKRPKIEGKGIDATENVTIGELLTENGIYKRPSIQSKETPKKIRVGGPYSVIAAGQFPYSITVYNTKQLTVIGSFEIFDYYVEDYGVAYMEITGEIIILAGLQYSGKVVLRVYRFNPVVKDVRFVDFGVETRISKLKLRRISDQEVLVGLYDEFLRQLDLMVVVFEDEDSLVKDLTTLEKSEFYSEKMFQNTPF